jgi:transposase
MIDYHINYNPVNGEIFKNYIIRLKRNCILKNINEPKFILYNARIHHYIGLKEILLEEGIVLKFLPPYSPMLNII